MPHFSNRDTLNIYTDAAFNQYENKGSYCYTIIHLLVRLTRSGIFTTKTEGPTEAELKAIYNALLDVLTIPHNAKQITIYNDCTAAIGLITKILPPGKNKECNDIAMEIIELIKRVEKQQDVEIFIKHVKGHTQSKNVHSVMQRECDAEAYRIISNLKIK